MSSPEGSTCCDRAVIVVALKCCFVGKDADSESLKMVMVVAVEAGSRQLNSITYQISHVFDSFTYM